MQILYILLSFLGVKHRALARKIILFIYNNLLTYIHNHVITYPVASGVVWKLVDVPIILFPMLEEHRDWKEEESKGTTGDEENECI